MVLLGMALAAGHLQAQAPVQLPAPAGRYIDGVIANVAGRIVLYSDLEGRLQQARQGGEVVTDELACGQLEDLLYQQLLLEQARIDSVVVDENQVNAELDRRISYFEQQIGGREKLEKFYGKSVTEIKADFREQVADQLLSQQMQQKIVGDVRVTPREVEKFFKSIPKDSLPFINAGVEFARISIYAKPTDAEDRRVRQKLEEYRESIVKGEKDFCTVAILYSEDPGSAAQCGELGMVPQGVMVPEFDAVALSLKDGEISPVFKTQYGYHIMEMIERKGDRYNARHILLAAKPSPADIAGAKDRLDSLMTMVRDGKMDFNTAASAYNEDEETKGTNGLVLEPNSNGAHWATGDLDQRTFMVLDKLQQGQISEPIAFEDPDGKKGYRVLRLIKRTEPHRMDLLQDYPLVQQAAEAKLRQRNVDAWVKEKLSGTYVKIIPAYRGCKFEQPWLAEAEQEP
ncbi:MAG TPA: peptidylprolyl isomerase [Flavobacteriales bacterium]|nr:peptidylprolyl isomerase [Flavobacteriales bacterium]HRP81979.1 peptidylprolyl isomerase [Flavobacteriales bacterium]HRQ84473.1 peptidylprolyl isomerase [Flavobacteriales bacterium]